MYLTINTLTFIFAFWHIDGFDEQFNECRFNTKGTDYVGKVSKSYLGAECQFWNFAFEQNKIDHPDTRFPDGSRILARNYCRNPTGDAVGPWCYVKQSLEKVACNVPFCYSNDCRWTGAGEEFNGTVTRSVTGRECLPWVLTAFQDHRLVLQLCPDIGAEECKSCRNLDHIEAGPWCMVQQGKNQVKELCDIAYCHNRPVILMNGGNSDVTNFHKIANSTSSSLQGKVRLWQADAWPDARVAILLSVFDVATRLKDLKSWGSAVIISIGNAGSVIMGSEIYDRVDTPGILTASKWANVTVSWIRNPDNNVLVTVFLNGAKKPSLIADLDTSLTLLEANDFQYFGVVGTPGLWDFSTDSQSCLETTTSHGSMTFLLEMEKDFAQTDLSYFFRLSDAVTIHLRGSPTGSDLFNIQIYQSGRVIMEEIADSRVNRVSDVTITPFDYWAWERISLSFLGDHLLAVRRHESGAEVAANVTGVALLRLVLWIGVSSKSVSHWAFNCDPTDLDPIAKPEPPECTANPAGLEYNGTQNLASSGKHCVPWIDKTIPANFQNAKLFQLFGGRLRSVNYCRNLDLDASGPFCFVQQSGDRDTVEKQLCSIRPCMMGECKHAGTGSDYIGELAVSASHRACRLHLNETFGYCRNPTQNLGGPWCFTDDPLAPKDFCTIKDCDRPATHTLLVYSSRNSSNLFILPSWRKHGLRFWLKNWNPERDASVHLSMVPSSGKSWYKLIIGGGANEKIQLKLVDSRTESLLFEETAAHLVRSGGWTGLWLRCGLGSVELGHEGMDIPFFFWENGPLEMDKQLLPMFLSFGTGSNAWVGVNFRASECLVERVWNNTMHHLWPINLWKDGPGAKKTIDFFFQGSGSFIINLLCFPGEGEFISLVAEAGKTFRFFRVSKDKRKELNSTDLTEPGIVKNMWTQLSIRFEESYVELVADDFTILSYAPAEVVLLFYWFYVDVTAGLFAWAANCQPLELGGEPQNGGWGAWSPWTCNVLCGGGEGRRERSCDSPAPNLLGKECDGPAVYEGVCNDFPCGDIPPNLSIEIRKRLALGAVTLSVERGGRITLPCNKDLAEAVQANIPEVQFVWTVNGFPPNTSRAFVGLFELELKDADMEDSGVWACTASWTLVDNDKNVVIGVSAIVVTSEYPTALVRETLSLIMHCNCVILSHIYGDLSVKWEHDGSVWRDYGPSTLFTVATEEVSNVNYASAGVWTCVVSQEELGLQWTTSWTRVQVIPAPNFWSNLIEDEATAPIFGQMDQSTAKIVFVLSILVLIAIPIVVIVIYNTL